MALMTFLLLGCVHQVQVRTWPMGAAVEADGVEVRGAPPVVEARPFHRPTIKVYLPGYRPATFSLSRTGTLSFVGDFFSLRWPRALGLVPYAVVEVRLVREHEGIGTWEADDLE